MPMVFQKKGSPPPAGPSAMPGKGLVIEIGHGGASDEGGPPAPDVGGAVACPNCGCQFDPATGEVQGGDYEQGAPEEEAAPEEEEMPE